jgi:porin
MCIGAKVFFRALVLLTAATGLGFAAYGQEPKSTSTSTSAAQGATAAKPARAAPAAAVEQNFWTQEGLTGDWGGTRSGWKEANGVELEFKFSQFVQGVASGGVDKGAVGNGKFQTIFKFDLGKLVGWKFWSLDVRTETRFGGPLLTGTGALNPVNTTALIPTPSGTAFTISALNITRLIPIDLKKGDLFAVSVGRFNMLDLLEEDFFAGSGTERFFNMAQIGPLTVLREVPIITNAVSFAYVRGGEPFITFAILDPNDHSLDPGLSDLYSDGVTFAPGINFPAKHFGKTAKHSFGAAITTKAYTPFDAIKQIIIPGPPVNPIEPESGSWSVNYVFRQYLVERGRKDGWGFFTQLAAANRSTSPITAFVSAGIGGNGLVESRRNDEFGIAYAYSDLSEVLKDNIDPLAIGLLRAEHQVEVFYNFHITPWLRLTGDLQILRPVRPRVDTAIVPGGRLEIIF